MNGQASSAAGKIENREIDRVVRLQAVAQIRAPISAEAII